MDPTLGKFAKVLRNAKGLSLKKAAGTISIGHLSDFENGKVGISAQLFLELLQNLNVTPSAYSS
ncbi:helix-turn-helix domain-containing protein, partial [Pseudomonas aeruginosa]|uniref:helix-turn-helix domain-containing protein n=1 Tax=Pseudomonas aeruginosa TaxID=287 RepID=UPI00374806EA